MKIGVTGTREGANGRQLQGIVDFLKTVELPAELHHGDCEGVDIEVAAIAKALGFRIVCHPPEIAESQGFFGGDEFREPAGYMKRDRAIVDICDLLLVVPLQNEWQPKGGTWYTHDYAVQIGKPTMVFYPGVNHD